MTALDALDLPPWAVVSDRRRAHIARVTALLGEWARAMSIDSEEAATWHDAGRWHDALRDAPPESLRELVGEYEVMPQRAWHGPAAARRLALEGEERTALLEAIRFHTLGHRDWARPGRALYMADFLEPGRPFDVARRAELAARVPEAFDATFREVVRARIEHTLRAGQALLPATVELWNAVR